ncbi:MAG: hypothetical protein RIQ68_60 [Pseudomonadota bacterium]|jgi:hypothetical protein
MTHKRLSLAFGLICSLTAQAGWAQDVPFAAPPYKGTGNREPMLLALSDLMSLAQSRHIKLWQAGKANHYELVTYEANKLSESLFRAAALYSNIPVPLVKAADEALMRISASADKRNGAEFQNAFRDLTKACNDCHQAAGIAFVKIKTPTASLFTNQDFTTAK